MQYQYSEWDSGWSSKPPYNNNLNWINSKSQETEELGSSSQHQCHIRQIVSQMNYNKATTTFAVANKTQNSSWATTARRIIVDLIPSPCIEGGSSLEKTNKQELQPWVIMQKHKFCARLQIITMARAQILTKCTLELN